MIDDSKQATLSRHAERLSALRAQLDAQGLDGFVVPLTDEHMSEYVGAYAQRLAWLTGFGGSAGTVIVLKDKAAILVDGRYTIQVREQVDGSLYDYVDFPANTAASWLADHVSQGARIGYDAWLHTRDWVRETADAIARKSGELVAVERNPVDAIWEDRPAPSAAPVELQQDAHAGRSAREKREEIADWLNTHGADAVVISALDSIAWALNIRGKDVERTPVALSYLVVHSDSTADFYIKGEKLSDPVRQALGNAVRVHDYGAFEGDLGRMNGKVVATDPERAVAAIFQALEQGGATILSARDPAVLAKAIKNPAEQAGHRAAQARDGAALARFLHWMSVEGPKGGVTELSAAEKLEAFRKETGLLEDQSFDTISGFGPNGAIPHYRVDAQSSRPIAPGSLYLVDSGGQYRDGTTDVTRTIAIGTPTAEMRDRFTRVLKGMIALTRAIFPEGTRGGQLDILARQYLWEAGLDYAHGTGHGVGSYLAVHEGPQRIAKPVGAGGGAQEPLRVGMILSNEPGYYKAGDYGIRIENLVLVEPRDVEGSESPMLGFETLTFAPIDRNLIDETLLTRAELQWLDAYHGQVRDLLGPQMEGEARAWLEQACAPIGRG